MAPGFLIVHPCTALPDRAIFARVPSGGGLRGIIERNPVWSSVIGPVDHTRPESSGHLGQISPHRTSDANFPFVVLQVRRQAIFEKKAN